MISLVVTCCYPLQAHPSRTCITTILNTTPIGEAVAPTLLHYIITTIFVVATGTIAFLVSDLGLVLSVRRHVASSHLCVCMGVCVCACGACSATICLARLVCLSLHPRRCLSRASYRRWSARPDRRS